MAAYGVRERLRTRWAEVHAGGERGGAPFPALRDGDFAGARQRAVFAVLNSYRDVLLPAYPYPTRCARSRLSRAVSSVTSTQALSQQCTMFDLAPAVRAGHTHAPEGGEVVDDDHTLCRGQTAL